MSFLLRQYDAARDEEPALALWLRTWQKTYPDIDFGGRLGWWREHWRGLLPDATIIVAEAKDEMIGFVTVDPRTLYLDQIVVAPEYWGSGLAGALLAEARRLSPRGLDLDVRVGIHTGPVMGAHARSTKKKALLSPVMASTR